MYHVLLAQHWKAVRIPLFLLGVATFAVPLLAVEHLGWNTSTGWIDVSSLLAKGESMSPIYPILAGALGLLLGLSAWRSDHRGHHVYSLSLPVDRWRYAGLRYAVATTLMIIPIGTLALGSVLATTFGALPEGLIAYPIALTIRFTLATALALSMTFAIAAGSIRTAGYVLASIGAILAIQVMLLILGTAIDFVSPVALQLIEWPGPFEVFSGRWMLFDV